MTERDPAKVDWTKMDDLAVESAARGGVPQAIAECHRRGLVIDHAAKDE
jgi:hypothetical protein